MNTVAGFRRMLGKTQKEMAKELGIGEVTYREKENGKRDFKESEMIAFLNLVNKKLVNISFEDIFLNRSRHK